MGISDVRRFFEVYNLPYQVEELPGSTATVALAAEALGVEPDRIAKTLTFRGAENPVVIVASGESRIDNAKFKAQFRMKARMLSGEEVPAATGHPVGGVSPFGLPDNIDIYLDTSLRRHDTVFPAGGAVNSAVRITPEELGNVVHATWIDVCKR